MDLSQGHVHVFVGVGKTASNFFREGNYVSSVQKVASSLRIELCKIACNFLKVAVL